MKKYILLFLVIFISCVAFTRKVPGYYIKPSGEKVKTIFKIKASPIKGKPNFLPLQSQVKTYINGKKLVLKPEMVQEIGFTVKEKQFVMKSVTDPMFKTVSLFKKDKPEGTLLLYCVVDGTMSLYKYYELKHTGGAGTTRGASTTVVTTTLFQRKGGELFAPGTFRVKKDLSEYFSNCPSLVHLIKEKKFKLKHADEIAKYYNTKCK